MRQRVRGGRGQCEGAQRPLHVPGHPERRRVPGQPPLDGLFMGVPVRLGAGGVEEVVKLRLSADEKKMLKSSAAAVREVVGVLTTS